MTNPARTSAAKARFAAAPRTGSLRSTLTIVRGSTSASAAKRRRVAVGPFIARVRSRFGCRERSGDAMPNHAAGGPHAEVFDNGAGIGAGGSRDTLDQTREPPKRILQLSELRHVLTVQPGKRLVSGMFLRRRSPPVHGDLGEPRCQVAMRIPISVGPS
jgi:hypothetical protein